ncbi:MAG: lipoprotein [Parvibaculum sp.]
MTRQTTQTTHRATMAITALAILLALGACGRKGDLEPPPGISPDMAKTDTTGCPPANADTPKPIDANPGGAQSGNPNRMAQDDLPPC